MSSPQRSRRCATSDTQAQPDQATPSVLGSGPEARVPSPSLAGIARLPKWLNLNVWFVISACLVASSLQLGLIPLVLGVGAGLYWYFKQRPELKELAGTRPPSWLADPLENHTWRWWDGSKWTDHTDGNSEKPVAVPVGWHVDPLGTHTWRWWDGNKWADHTSDMASPPTGHPLG